MVQAWTVLTKREGDVEGFGDWGQSGRETKLVRWVKESEDKRRSQQTIRRRKKKVKVAPDPGKETVSRAMLRTGVDKR